MTLLCYCATDACPELALFRRAEHLGHGPAIFLKSWTSWLYFLPHSNCGTM